MDKSITSNKMINLETENKAEIKFNAEIHGFRKGQVVKYRSVPNAVKVLIRRRIADKDGSVEILLPEKKIQDTFENKMQPSKPTNGKKGSKKIT